MGTADQMIAIHRKAMENQKNVLIEKACEWIQKEVLEDYPYIIWPDIVKDFRKAMEE